MFRRAVISKAMSLGPTPSYSKASRQPNAFLYACLKKRLYPQPAPFSARWRTALSGWIPCPSKAGSAAFWEIAGEVVVCLSRTPFARAAATSSRPSPTAPDFPELMTNAIERIGFMGSAGLALRFLFDGRASPEAQQEFPVPVGALDRGVHRAPELRAGQAGERKVPDGGKRGLAHGCVPDHAPALVGLRLARLELRLDQGDEDAAGPEKRPDRGQDSLERDEREVH